MARPRKYKIELTDDELTSVILNIKTSKTIRFDADVKLLLFWMKLMEKFLPMNNQQNRMVYAWRQ